MDEMSSESSEIMSKLNSVLSERMLKLLQMGVVREGFWEEVTAESVYGDLGEENSWSRRQQRKCGCDAHRMPSMVSGWQVLN